jgi:hypothetical protein
MQINHSENCGKCHGNHIFGFDCQNSTVLIAGEVNCNRKIITWTSPASKTITNYFDEKVKIQSIKDEFLFSFEYNEDNIQFMIYLYKSTLNFKSYYSLYYKFEKDKSTKKEISRLDVYYHDLDTYVEIDMFELKINFEDKYNELIDICLTIKNGEI